MRAADAVVLPGVGAFGRCMEALDQVGLHEVALQAAKAAGLDATLAGPDPYTVFVPDDQAFAKLPAGTLEEWVRLSSIVSDVS